MWCSGRLTVEAFKQMTWTEFIVKVEGFLTLTALATAIGAGVEFIRSIRTAREVKRTSQVNAWRKASVQRLICKSEDYMTTAEITAALRSSSYDISFDINKDELTDEAVRLLLLELIRENVIGQIWPDSYGITQLPRDITLPMAAAHVRGNMAVRGAFALIHEHPNHYTDEMLFQKLKDNVGLSMPDFLLAISDLDTRSFAKKSSDGKWSAVVSQIEGKQ